jgi:uncharacterized protein YbjT (DUF2867 family)
VTLLVTGASGNIGGELVQALTAAGEQVRALTHGDPPATLPHGVEVAVGDLNQPDSLASALEGVSGVFLLSGYADMPALFSTVDDAGVDRVVLLSSGAVVGGDISNAVVRYNVDSETALRNSGVPGTILRPSGFHSNALRWIPQLHGGNVVREPFASVPIAAIDPLDIAAVAALALTQPNHQGASYRLTGPEAILPADRVRILAQVLDRDIRLEPLSDEQARVEMSRDTPSEYVDAFFSFFADGTYDDSLVQPTVQQLLGRPPRSFEQWARAHANAFR